MALWDRNVDIFYHVPLLLLFIQMFTTKKANQLKPAEIRLNI